jgi:hypothetical protein
MLAFQSLRCRKIENIFWGEIQTPLLVHMIPDQNFCHQQPSFHLSTLSIVSGPFLWIPTPPDKFLKKPRVQIILLYEDGPWVRVMVGQMLHCKVVTHNIYFLKSFNHTWLNHIHQGKTS